MQAPEKVYTPSWTPPVDHMVDTPEVLFLRYHAYRRRQAAALLHVMPREAVRDLYGQARDWAKEQGVHDARDPMSTLVRYAEHILPLPSFEVWSEDRKAYPLGHLEDYTDGPHAPAVSRPGKIDERVFQVRGESWEAGLLVFREGNVWRGFLSFRRPGTGNAFHTANIFREDSASDIRARFEEFDDQALSAFLTSALP